MICFREEPRGWYCVVVTKPELLYTNVALRKLMKTYLFDISHTEYLYVSVAVLCVNR